MKEKRFNCSEKRFLHNKNHASVRLPHRRQALQSAKSRGLAIALEGYLDGLENWPRTMRDKHGTLKAPLKAFAKLPIGSITKLHMIEALEAYPNRPAIRRKPAA